MGIDKAEIKVGMAKELGRKYADMMKSQSNELIMLDGEKRAYKKVIEAFDSYFKAVDADLDRGAFELNEPMAIAKEVKKALGRALAGVDNLKDGATALTLTVHGRLDALTKVSEVVQKVAETEQKKIEAVIEAAIERPKEDQELGAPPSRPTVRFPGVRPGPSIAAQRRAEGAKKTEEKTPQGALSALGETVTQGAVRSTKSGVLQEGGTAKKKTAKKKTAKKKTAKKTTTKKTAPRK